MEKQHMKYRTVLLDFEHKTRQNEKRVSGIKKTKNPKTKHGFTAFRSTFSSNYSKQRFPAWCYQSVTSSGRKFDPLFLTTLLQFIEAHRHLLMHSSFRVPPQQFSRVEVWTLKNKRIKVLHSSSQIRSIWWPHGFTLNYFDIQRCSTETIRPSLRAVILLTELKSRWI